MVRTTAVILTHNTTIVCISTRVVHNTKRYAGTRVHTTRRDLIKLIKYVRTPYRYYTIWRALVQVMMRFRGSNNSKLYVGNIVLTAQLSIILNIIIVKHTRA